MTPLLSGKPLSAFTPEEYKTYVLSLHKEPQKAAPPAETSVRLNDKGNPVITVRREPKWLTAKEIDSLAEQAGLSKQRMWTEVRKRKIEVKFNLP